MALLLLLLACEAPPSACGDGGVEVDGRCVPSSCGEGRWGALAPSDDDVFVDAGADGDGTEDAPFGTIADGLAKAAGKGSRVLLAAGTYTEHVVFTDDHDGVTLAGRCAALVSLDGSEGRADEAVMSVEGADAEVVLTGFTVTNGQSGGIDVLGGEATIRGVELVENTVVALAAAGGDVHVEDVAVRAVYGNDRGVGGWGVYVSETTLDGTGLAVEGAHTAGLTVVRGGLADLEGCRVAATEPDASGEAYGVYLSDGEARLDGCTIEAVPGIGVFGGSPEVAITLTDTTIAGTTPNAAGIARAIHVGNGATLEGSGVTLTGNAQVGVHVEGGEARVTLTASTLTGTTAAEGRGTVEDGYGAAAARVIGGGTLTLDGVTIEDNAGAGVEARDDGTEVTLDDVTVSGTTEGKGDVLAAGLRAYDGARIRGEAVTLSGNGGAGVLASDGAEVDLTDCVIADGQAIDRAWGRGVVVQYDAAVALERCGVARNVEAGITAGSATLTMTDTEVSGTLPNAAGQGGYGAQLGDAATVTITGSTFADNVGTGVYVVSPSTEVTIDTSEILRTASDEDGFYGRGLEVSDGATVVVTASRVAENHEIGVVAAGAYTEVSLVDTEIADTRVLPDGRFGYGAAAHTGASLSVTGGLLTGNVGVGILGLSGASLVLDDVVVTGLVRGNLAVTAAGVSLSGAGSTLDAEGLDASGNEGVGLYVAVAADAACADCTFTDDSFAGVVLLDAALALDGATIDGIVTDPSEGGGVGLFADGSYGTTSLDLRGATIGAAPLAAVWIVGPGRFLVDGSTLTGGEGKHLPQGPYEGPHVHGDAVYATGLPTAWDGTTGLAVTASTLRESSGAGVFLDAATASLSGNTFTGNTTDLVQQACTDSLPTPDGAADLASADLCPPEDQLVETLVYELYPGDPEAGE